MSSFRWVRKYVGPVKALVLDFSGTTCDRYVLAPAFAFQQIFKQYGLEISMTESRGPPGTMGQRKDLHIAILLEQPKIREKWIEKYGRPPSQSDVQAMYSDFVPVQLESLRPYGKLIPGTAQAIARLRRYYGVKVGVTTGFNRAMADILLREAKRQRFVPDACVASDDCENGARPKPHMLYRNLELMDISQIHSVVKVDDSSVGIGEGLNAGCWTVGVARWSSYMDVDSLEEAYDMTYREIKRRTKKSADLLWRAGAHYVIDDITKLSSVVKDVNARLAVGETP